MLRQSSPASASAATRLGFREFLLLVAAMQVCQAIAIDAMLPALPTIARALHVTDQNRAQWVVTAYMAGIGCGQLAWGMLSDRFGRRRILLTGLAMYAVAAYLSSLTTDFSALLAWRFVDGVAAACTVVARSVIRDLYSGHQMARVMSLTFIVFLMSPVLAPSLGQLLLLAAPWRFLFVMFGAFGTLVWVWVLLRLPETLHAQHRRELGVAQIRYAATLVITDRISLCYTLAIAFVMGCLFAYLGMVQQIFGQVFHRPTLMPTMFALCALTMGVASYLNSRLVARLGMAAISQTGVLLLALVAAAHVLVAAVGHESMMAFVVLQAATLGCVGLIVGNFGALAMEPMGSVAGIAASLQGFISTLGAALLGALIGYGFHGSAVPLALGSLACGAVCLLFVLVAEKWRLFRPQYHPIPVAALGE
ncbi:MAG TPA: multidrug effflux MFS transporter [Steroidobacteraceae bacterium]|jgi:DHA1 family bicyclomycin/chloramphenicol resistance-like MFS transporter|nr:multidrug effflux MFS transporter [Steroidobacteraceae bacterium]